MLVIGIPLALLGIGMLLSAEKQRVASAGADPPQTELVSSDQEVRDTSHDAAAESKNLACTVCRQALSESEVVLFLGKTYCEDHWPPNC